MKESEKPSGSIVAANRTELNQSQKLVVTSDGLSAPMVPVELVLTKLLAASKIKLSVGPQICHQQRHLITSCTSHHPGQSIMYPSSFETWDSSVYVVLMSVSR